MRQKKKKWYFAFVFPYFRLKNRKFFLSKRMRDWQILKLLKVSHHIRLKHSEAIIVKFVSHKVKSQVYKARTRLKNVSLTGLFQDRPASSRTESNRIDMCESLTAYRRHLVNKLNTKRRNNERLSVWTMDGKVFVKTSPEGSPIRIFCDEDLDNL